MTTAVLRCAAQVGWKEAIGAAEAGWLRAVPCGLLQYLLAGQKQMSHHSEEVEPCHIAWAEVLQYLPIFDQLMFNPGAWVEAEGTLPFFRYSRESAGFVEALYSAGVVFNFDWPEWQAEAERLVSNPEALAAADLSTLRKLLTTHVRKDRFCEGHLASVLESGHIASVLRRIATLV